MSLSIGTRLGPYEVLNAIGAGGMGEVYRARDNRLNRDVAIKVLTDRFAGDADRLRRLRREAQLLAALNHAHIATVHGLEEADGIVAIVMELVDGEDLKQRLVRGSIPLDEALTVARQIADALEAAHGLGMVHRDLKPANIKVRRDGTVKVLDFGLAKIAEPTSSSSTGALDDSPTMTSPAAMTAAGMLLGTAAYMSPEQARGKPADTRSDIWAFGCVLFEMLTARSTFPGETVSDTLAAVLQREPRWDLLPADTPDEIRRLLRRCLDKDPKRRLHDIADARIEIDDARNPTRPDRAILPRLPRSPSRQAAIGAAVLLGILAAGTAGWFLRPNPAAPELRFELNTPPTADPSVAISPDGLRVVFVGTSGSQSQLWLRSLDSSSARPLAGTERASTPFWSPDSRSIGFFADGRLRRMDIDGRSVRTLSSESAVPLGGTWNRDDIILFADNPGGPIVRISADGGERSAVTRVGVPQQRGHHSPQFLPDGRHFLFFVSGSPEARGVYIGQLDTPDTKRLFDAVVPATFAAPGHLLFLRENTLYAQRFDPVQGELSGDAFAVQEPVSTRTTLSASASGPIVYRTRAGSSPQRQFVRVDRTGREIDRVVYPDGAALGPALSHDGRRIAVYRFANGNMDIWSYEVNRRVWDRITFDSGDDIYPLWSPDDSSIIFAGARAGFLNLYLKRLGTPPDVEELVLSTSEPKFPMDWSADGRFLLYSSGSPKQGRDIWAFPLQGERQPFEVVRTDFNETQAQFSPDGTWIAYQSDRSGRDEIYLRPFPGPGSDVAVSTEGGSQVRWNANGKELFYVATDDRLVAVPVGFSSDNKTVAPGTPAGLFATNVGSTATLKYRQQYVVARDGQSFVMNSAVDEGSVSPITVILNWKPTR